MPTITGTAGSDVLVGGPDDDDISDWLGGSDLLQGLGGDDTLYIARSSFSEYLTEPIRLEGGTGDDTLILDVRNRAPLILDGGEGNDFFQFWSLTGPVTLITGAGSDRIYFDGLRMGDSSGQLVITDFTTGAGGDLFDLLDWLPARIGEWGANNPFSTGHLQLTQDGADTTLVMGHRVLVTFQNTLAADFTAANLRWSPDGVGGAAGEVFSGTAESDRIIGTNGDDVITGGAGADIITGNAGDDQIDGGAGQDQITGGIGSDIIHGGDDADWIEDYHGIGDALYGDDGNDNIKFYRSWDEPVGDLIADGGDGDDVIWLTLYNDTFVDVFGGAGDDVVQLSVNQGRVRITTGAGRDSIDINGWLPGDPAITVTDFTPGETGDHILWLGLIDNTLQSTLGGSPFASGHARLIQSGPDTLLQVNRDGGGDDWDTRVVFENTSATAFTAENFGGYAPSGAELAGQTLNGTSAADTIDGTRGDDVITLSGGDDRSYGRQGHDVIDGGDGNDILDGQEGSDTLWGGAGDDQLDAGGSGADVLHGGDGADILNLGRDHLAALQQVEANGDDGDDTIYLDLRNGASAIVRGGAGDDAIFVGNGGDVTVSTGAGADTITYGGYYTPLPARLEITDFVVGTDTLDWTNFRGTFQGLNGANPFLAGYARLVQDGADAVLQFDPDGGANDFVGAIRFRDTDATTLSGAALGFQALAFDHVGTAASEFLFGSYLADRLDGGGGFDVLQGGGGDDILNGGDGSDQASFADATSGVVVDLRQTGPQAVGGGLESDTLISIEGIIGSAFGDHLTGDDGVNFISGGDGDDVINGGLGADWLAGDGGNDLFVFTSVSLTPVVPIGSVSGGLGVDTLDLTALGGTTFGQSSGSSFRLTVGGQRYAVSGIERILTGGEADVIDVRNFTPLEIWAGDGDDIIQTGQGADTLHGGDGDDILNGGRGSDILDGGAGIDTASYAGMTTGVEIYLDLGISWDGTSTDFFTSIENATGSSHNDYIVGTSGANTLNGGAGDDFLFGMGGDDLLIGGAGVDRLDGGEGVDTAHYGGMAAGVEVYLDNGISWDGTSMDFLTSIENVTGSNFNDYIVGTAAANLLVGGSGDDFLFGMAGDDILIGGVGVDRLDGGEGNDTIGYALSATGVEVYLDNGVSWDGTSMDFLTSIENVTGSAHNDYIVGTAVANILIGGDGNDFLFGMGGDDLLIGGAGVDRLDGGEGNDTITYEDSAAGVEIYLDNGVSWDGTSMDFLTSIENVTGSDHNDYIVGTAGANLLIGGDGDDILYGMDGDDILAGGAGVDQMFGGEGNDTITYATSTAGVEIYLNNGISWDGTSVDFLDSIENVIGSAHNDYIVGTAGDNVLNGGAGDDILTGGAGNDTLDGGDGTDTAIYSGNRAAYTISILAGVTTVSGPDGTDTLTHVERLQFADGLFDISGNPLAAPLVDDAQVMPVLDDGFILTGKPDEAPPVMPALSDAFEPWVMPAVFDPAQDFLTVLAFEGSQRTSDNGLTLLDEWSGLAPSRHAVWE